MFGRSSLFQIDTETLREHVRVTMANLNPFSRRVPPTDQDSGLIQAWRAEQREGWLRDAEGSLLCHANSKAWKTG